MWSLSEEAIRYGKVLPTTRFRDKDKELKSSPGPRRRRPRSRFQRAQNTHACRVIPGLVRTSEYSSPSHLTRTSSPSNAACETSEPGHAFFNDREAPTSTPTWFNGTTGALNMANQQDELQNDSFAFGLPSSGRFSEHVFGPASFPRFYDTFPSTPQADFKPYQPYANEYLGNAALHDDLANPFPGYSTPSYLPAWCDASPSSAVEPSLDIAEFQQDVYRGRMFAPSSDVEADALTFPGLEADATGLWTEARLVPRSW